MKNGIWEIIHFRKFKSGKIPVIAKRARYVTELFLNVPVDRFENDRLPQFIQLAASQFQSNAGVIQRCIHPSSAQTNPSFSVHRHRGKNIFQE